MFAVWTLWVLMFSSEKTAWRGLAFQSRTTWLKSRYQKKLRHILTDAFLYRVQTEKVVNFLRAEVVKPLYLAGHILEHRRLLYIPELLLPWSLCQQDEDFSTLWFLSHEFFYQQAPGRAQIYLKVQQTLGNSTEGNEINLAWKIPTFFGTKHYVME